MPDPTRTLDHVPSEDDPTRTTDSVPAPADPTRTGEFTAEPSTVDSTEEGGGTGEFFVGTQTMGTAPLPDTHRGTDHSPDAGHFSVSPPSEGDAITPEGSRLHAYEILGELGAGGMGVVYKARQPSLNRMVALKMVLAGGRATKTQITRFRGEAMAVAKLDHPNIVKVYDIGEHDGLPFFAMEYIDGGGLDSKLKREPLEPREAASLAETLARAMDYAHGRGVIHRDLKPANVMLAPKLAARVRVGGSASGTFKAVSASKAATSKASTSKASTSKADVPVTDPDAKFRVADWEPKVTDFGLAKQVEDDHDHVTRTGAVMGTPNYMAPEQAEGRTKDVDHLADVYSLGACLYEFLTGRPPFSGASVVGILSQVRESDPVNPTQLAPGLPKDLETICLKCLQKDPAKRYASAGDLADDLRRFQAGESIIARPISTVEKMVRWVRRKPKEAGLWLTAAALAAFAVAAVSVGYLRSKAYNAELSQKNDEITRQKDAVEAERDVAERQQGFFADEWRLLSRDVITRLPPANLGKDREEFAGYMTKVLGRLNRLTAEDAGIAPRVRMAAAIMTGDTRMAIRRAGRITDLEDVREGLTSYTAAEAIARDAVKAEPDSDLARGNLALVKARQADARLALGDAAAAKADADEALALRREIVDNPRSAGNAKVRIFPADALVSLAESHAQLARWADAAKAAPAERKTHLAAATAHRKRALDMARADKASYDSDWIPLERFQNALAESYLTDAADAAAANQLGTGQKLLNDALALYNRSLADAADDLPNKPQLASLLFKLGQGKLEVGKPAEAADWFERMRQIADAILRAGGRAPEDHWRLWNSYYGLGVSAMAVGDKATAAAKFRDCVKLAEEFVREDPRPRNVWLLMLALARAGYPDRAVDVLRAERDKVQDANPQKAAARIPGRFYFIAASTYALAAHAVGRWEPDAKLTDAEKKQRADYLDAAWVAVGEVVRLNPPEAGKIESDPDLLFLQQQPGFKEKLAQVRAKYAKK